MGLIEYKIYYFWNFLNHVSTSYTIIKNETYNRNNNSNINNDDVNKISMSVYTSIHIPKTTRHTWCRKQALVFSHRFHVNLWMRQSLYPSSVTIRT